MTFEQALKVLRRNVYLHGKDWRTAIIAPNKNTLGVAWDEAKALITASSLGIERMRWTTRAFELERGAIIRFYLVDSELDQFKLAGQQFTHIIVLNSSTPYPAGAMEYLSSTLRSPVLKGDECRWDEGVVI